MAGKTSLIGSLIITLLLGGAILVTLSGSNVQFQFNKYDSVFSSKINDKWVVSGIEKNILFSPSGKIITPLNSKVLTENISNQYTVKRIVNYPNKIVIVDEYNFRTDTSDVTQFPVNHTINVFGAPGYTYGYQVSKLEVLPSSIVDKDSNSISFGKQMKVSFDQHYDNISIKGDTLLVTYKLSQIQEDFNNRLFDPPPTPTGQVALYYPMDAGVSNSSLTNDTSGSLRNGVVTNAVHIVE